MPHQRTTRLATSTSDRPRVARRYRTCAEALRAVAELELLAEDDVSHLREQGREAAADRRADAWNREIARALGEAEALRRAITNHVQAPPIRPGLAQTDLICRLEDSSPSRKLATLAVALVATVAFAWVIERLAPELLAAAAVTGTLSMLCRTKRPSRRRSDHGR
jgi:hypothetical protein